MKVINKYFGVGFVALFVCMFSMVCLADENTAKTEVVNVYQDWCSAIGTAKGDPSKIVKFYAPDAILLPTLSAKMLVNHDGGLNEYFTKLTSLPDIKCTPEKLVTKLHGDTAVNSGFYIFSYTGNGHPENISARFTFVYKKLDGQWLIIKHHSSKSPSVTN